MTNSISEIKFTPMDFFQETDPSLNDARDFEALIAHSKKFLEEDQKLSPQVYGKALGILSRIRNPSKNESLCLNNYPTYTHSQNSKRDKALFLMLFKTLLETPNRYLGLELEQKELNRLKSAGLAQFINNHTSLRNLSLQGCKIPSKNLLPILQSIGDKNQLTSLNLSSVRINLCNALTIGKFLEANKTLITLSLNRTKLTLYSLAALIRSLTHEHGNKTLRVINLSESLSDDCRFEQPPDLTEPALLTFGKELRDIVEQMNRIKLTLQINEPQQYFDRIDRKSARGALIAKLIRSNLGLERLDISHNPIKFNRLIESTEFAIDKALVSNQSLHSLNLNEICLNLYELISIISPLIPKLDPGTKIEDLCNQTLKELFLKKTLERTTTNWDLLLFNIDDSTTNVNTQRLNNIIYDLKKPLKVFSHQPDVRENKFLSMLEICNVIGVLTRKLLEGNTTLTTLDLSCNGLEKVSCAHIAYGLKSNTTLKRLYLEGNHASEDIIGNFVGALNMNYRLQTLTVGIRNLSEVEFTLLRFKNLNDLIECFKINRALTSTDLFNWVKTDPKNMELFFNTLTDLLTNNNHSLAYLELATIESRPQALDSALKMNQDRAKIRKTGKRKIGALIAGLQGKFDQAELEPSNTAYEGFSARILNQLVKQSENSKKHK